jgi:hypothetical protein
MPATTPRPSSSEQPPSIRTRGRVQSESPAAIVGIRSRRPLTLKMIRRLHEGLGIPAEALIKLRPDRAA